jgi:CYTH domain-containing protein
MNEIQRKFFVKTSLDVSGLVPFSCKQYFLKRGGGLEERVSKVQNIFFYDKIIVLSSIERIRDRKEITQEEFNTLTKDSHGAVVLRNTYLLSSKPKITLHVYKGKFKGLIRAEVKFDSVKEANSFKPLPWMGKEITGLDIARNSTLLNLTQKEFLSSLRDLL